MTRIPRTRRWLSVPAPTAGPAGHRWQPPPSPPDPWAGDSEGSGIPPVAGWPSFRRPAGIEDDGINERWSGLAMQQGSAATNSVYNGLGPLSFGAWAALTIFNGPLAPRC